MLLIFLAGTAVSAVAGAFIGILGGFRMVLGIYQRRLSVLHSRRLISSDSREVTSILERVKVVIGLGQSPRPAGLMVAAVPALIVAVLGILVVFNSDPSSIGWAPWFFQTIIWGSTLLTGILAGLAGGEFAARTTLHDVLLESVLPTEQASQVVEGALEVLGRVSVFRELLRLSSLSVAKNFSIRPGPSILGSGAGPQPGVNSFQGQLSQQHGFVECASCKRMIPETQLAPVTDAETQHRFPSGTMLCLQCLAHIKFGISQPPS
jgi:hypothetical protein